MLTISGVEVSSDGFLVPNRTLRTLMKVIFDLSLFGPLKYKVSEPEYIKLHKYMSSFATVPVPSPPPSSAPGQSTGGAATDPFPFQHAYIPWQDRSCPKVEPGPSTGGANKVHHGPVICRKCNEKNDFAEPNQSDGSFVCYGCR